jgi:hypothetical protein
LNNIGNTGAYTFQQPFIDKQHHTENEIDLLELFIKVLRIVKQYFKFILFSIFCGLVAGILWYHYQTPAYKSSLLLKNNFLDKQEAVEIIHSLHYLTQQESTLPLAQVLEISNQAASTILNIYPEVKKDAAAEDTKLQLSVVVSDQNYLVEIQDGLVGYLNNNSYCQKKLKAERTMKSELLSVLKEEETNLDSLYSLSVRLLTSSSSSMIIDMADIVRQKARFREDQLKLISELNTLTAFDVIQRFPDSNPRINKPLPQVLAIATGISLLVSVLVIAYRECAHYMKGKPLPESGLTQHLFTKIA